MKLTKNTFNAEDIIMIVSGNTNVTIPTEVLKEFLNSNETEIKVGRG